MSFDALAFFAGAARQKQENWREEDKRREDYHEKMEALYAAGIEERKKSYAAMSSAYGSMKQSLDAGDDAAAWAAYASLHEDKNAKKVSEALGYDVEIAANPAARRAMMENAYNSFSRREEPSYDPEKMIIDREQFYRANEAEWKAYVNDKFGVDTEADEVLGTPYKGVRGSLFQRVPEKDPTADLKPIRLPFEGPGGTEAYRIGYIVDGKFVETDVVGKGPAKARRDITRTEQSIINTEIQERFENIEDDKSIDPVVREALEDLVQEKNKPVQTAIASEAMRLMSRDSNLDAEAASRMATDTFLKAAESGGIKREKGLFSDSYSWSPRTIQMRTPDGKTVYVPFEKVSEFLSNGGSYVNE